MTDSLNSIQINDIILDNDIYPRSVIDHKRVAMFEENIRDGFEFDPIHLQAHPDKPEKYRILDGVHRFQAYKGVGEKEIRAEIIKLNGTDPLLYAAHMAIGPRQLNDDEAKDTARRAYQNNPKLSSETIGRAIGRARRTVDSYISDLRAVIQSDLELKIFLLDRLGIPQERIAGRLGQTRDIIRAYLGKKATLPKSPNSDLEKGFTVAQVAEKHGWPESLVWSLKLEGKDDLPKCKELGWGIRTWDNWNWPDCDRRFGDEWPGRIPAQLVAHILFFFSKKNDLILDPMSGGAVTADTCLALNRRCWSFDMLDRPDTRSEIEPFYWDINKLIWPVKGKTKPDLIFFDPPYFSKKAKEYKEESISNLSRKDYIDFLERFFRISNENCKNGARFVMINADWRDFQGTPAMNETRKSSILLPDYWKLMESTGWEVRHIIQAPMSSERFQANVVAAMQRKKILGVTSRYVLVGRKV